MRGSSREEEEEEEKRNSMEPANAINLLLRTFGAIVFTFFATIWSYIVAPILHRMGMRTPPSVDSFPKESDTAQFDSKQDFSPGIVRVVNFVGQKVKEWNIYDPLASTSPRSIFEMVRMTCSWKNFGTPDPMPELQKLLDSLKKEGYLTFMGKLMVRKEILRLLRNRLEIEKTVHLNPQILNIAIRKPVFIVGLPRSGGGQLYNLLGRDDKNFQFLHYFETQFPIPLSTAFDGRKELANKLRQFEVFLVPNLDVVQYVRATGPGDDSGILEHTFRGGNFHKRYHIPSFKEYLERSKEENPQFMVEAYQYYKKVLQCLLWHKEDLHPLLRGTMHLASLNSLLDQFPDACVIWMHRDPSVVIPSNCSTIAHQRKVTSQWVNAHSIGKEVLRYSSHQLSAGLHHRSEAEKKGMKKNFYDVQFDTFQKDPMAVIKNIYSHFGFHLDPNVERTMITWSENKRKNGIHKYSLEQFGLTRGDIEEKTRDYCDRFLKVGAQAQ